MTDCELNDSIEQGPPTRSGGTLESDDIHTSIDAGVDIRTPDARRVDDVRPIMSNVSRYAPMNSVEQNVLDEYEGHRKKLIPDAPLSNDDRYLQKLRGIERLQPQAIERRPTVYDDGMKSVYEPGIHTALDDSNPDQMIGRRLYHGLKRTEWDRPPSGLVLRKACGPRRFMPSAGERCPTDILVDVFETTRITMVRWCAPRTSVRSPPQVPRS